ncbi:Beta-xylosidase [Chitinophaga terrae (ex Kim and Jung 2007)]|uniref:Beta-xylosidase n=1 Tax=Chitinophaga terrae (ex Kim and Jung 2007) TaxID=408074 RepID=A0A1H3ZI53_9BACT|nr:glycoside hydrolase 43 family protein [Chitinophaga terrae (ex Kim and Jung 2007)]GEP88765.1 glycosyl hydrolase [Chitinophaga terrae (ex Kim and Jung 2007)]SEA23380.1 Beta-xylosidase [Chitinophaga terrae (ex Kim and Jung 2007)]
MRSILTVVILFCSIFKISAQSAHNPIIYADVPDLSMIRVDSVYYMSSTTMHMSPGLPIMRSTDLVNWQLLGYVYDTLADVDALNLKNGKNAYGQGSWASSLRYENNTFYATTFSGTTGKTYIYTTKDIEKGDWERHDFRPLLHDHSLFFDNGKAYMVYGSGKIRITELKPDLSGIQPGGLDQVIIENAGLPAGGNVGLPAEGSQLFKIDGAYFLFNICWPKGGMRTVVIHKADKLTGPYTGRVALQDKGVAQGGLINTPQGNWWAYLFKDQGAVGRVPYLVPVQWKDGWPVLGVNGRVPDSLELPASKGYIPGLVASDEFNEKQLPLVWQWNHNPDNKSWSLTRRKGYLRLTTSHIATSPLDARNTLTQRTIGPECSAITSVDLSGMKEGDVAGLLLLQKNFGWAGIRMLEGKKYLVMETAVSGEQQRLPLSKNKLYLKASCDFRQDKGSFYYSFDGEKWSQLGDSFKLVYTLPHFMGYRFGLFNYAAKTTGGYADFDFFHIEDHQ